MSNEVVKKYRTQVPSAHRGSLDTRLAWLWNQRFGTVQKVWAESQDLLDHSAANLILQAIMVPDLNSIELLMQRIEGGAQEDTVVQERALRF